MIKMKPTSNNVPLRYEWNSPDIKVKLEIEADYLSLNGQAATALMNDVLDCLRAVSDLPKHYYGNDDTKTD